MKRILYGTVACLLVASCSSRSDSEATKSTQQDLDVTKTGSLTRMQGTIANASRETDRQQDTDLYYQTVRIGSDGQSGPTVKTGLNTLTLFKSTYGFDGSANEKVAKYYNRGDLGIGREMHCVDQSATSLGQVACYVKNFAAGDDNTEFTFGLSSNIAFANMDAVPKANYFATVGMVFRKNALPGNNKVFFVVYNAQDTLSYAAALDRVGVQFATAFTPGQDNPSGHGTPGTNFNNHIPSNCVSCHGGQRYNINNSGSNRFEIGSMFLPFDLDQFDFDGAHPRDETAFRALNQVVRNVAEAAGPTIDLNSSVRNQLDLWYNNPSHTATLNGNFTQAIPGDWNATTDSRALYVNVIRGSCRNCHMTNDIANLHFDSEAQFNTPGVRAQTKSALCNYLMPHSLQSVRNFWQSGQPAAFEAYLRSPAGGNDSALAISFHDCGPGDVATLDPPQIGAALGSL